MSMPLLGLIPFLQSLKKTLSRRQSLCQCPYSGLSHFYQYERNSRWMVLHRCQCPYSGLSHFYATSPANPKPNGNCVNALTRAYPISTASQRLTRHIPCSVSMPLLGLIPFLQTCFTVVTRHLHHFPTVSTSWLCQCPYSGLSHFYN